MKKIRSSALLLAVFISFLIAVILSFVMLRTLYLREVQNIYKTSNICRDNLSSAIALCLTNSTDAEYSFSGNLFEDDLSKVNIQCRRWGLFNVATVTSITKTQFLRKSFMIGTLPSGVLNACLYLGDHNKPLLLAGDALLKGDVYLPKMGVSATHINGQGFKYDQFFRGTEKRSSSEIHELLSQGIVPRLDQLIKYEDVRNTDYQSQDHTQSFSDTIFQSTSKEKIIIKNTLKGQIIITSTEMIEVSSTAVLENVIISAPHIKINDGFSGKLQVIATDSITVGNKCHFSYPSSLILYKQKNEIQTPCTMSIGEDCVFNGAIFTYTPLTDDKIKILTRVGNGFQMSGVIFSNGFLELKGIITGCLITDHTILRKESSIFDNHIMDATIDRQSLSSNFLMPMVFNTTKNENKVLLWLEN